MKFSVFQSKSLFVIELFIWRNKDCNYFIVFFIFHRHEEKSSMAVAVQGNRDLGRHVVQNFVHAIRAGKQKARCSSERVRLMVMNFREARPPGWFHNARAMPLLSLAWPTSTNSLSFSLSPIAVQFDSSFLFSSSETATARCTSRWTHARPRGKENHETR